MKVIYLIFTLILLGLDSRGIPPDYSFRNPVLLSGTNLQAGSRYRFSNVKPATDAIVTIVLFTAGVSLTSLDDASAGYAEFKIEFVNAGTLIPRVMLEVPITPIDVDGDVFSPANLHEFDMVSINPLAYYIDYDKAVSDLSVTVSGNWVTGRNVAAINYPGIDSNFRRVMFSVVNANISSIDLRLGAQNGSGAANNRRKSLYFGKFVFENSFLSLKSLISFTGVQQNNTIDLQWKLAPDNSISTVLLEKGSTPAVFEVLENAIVKYTNTDNHIVYNYKEAQSPYKTSYYRLRIVHTDGNFHYSNVLVFRNQQLTNLLKVYPTVIESSATMNVQSTRPGNGTFQLVDHSGRIIAQYKIQIQSGYNTIMINNLGSIRSGYYVASLIWEDTQQSSKVYKR
ncbi:MAG: hypothetical protein ACXWCT_12935 [Flavitalea sp.]